MLALRVILEFKATRVLRVTLERIRPLLVTLALRATLVLMEIRE